MMNRKTLEILACFALFVVLCASCNAGTNAPQSSKYDITATIDPNPPKVGQHSMMLHISTKDGIKVAGANLMVYPNMPAHGHGSTEEPKVDNMGDGAYKVSPVTFQMPGYWEIQVTIEVDGQKDVVTLSYDVR